ncbi:MAG: hypothetical protein K0S32_446 [Bacteroidetes bacterium]|jgi:hypothetical protein|nr:hypothetical protein [Bacteroidota bacterium]
MKKKISLALVSLTLLSVGTFAQTDTVRVVEKETTVVRDTVVKYEEPKKERPDFRVGELGFRYMPTFSSFALQTYNGDIVDGELVLSHGAGIMLGLNFSKNIGIVGEVNYLETSQKFKDRNLERTVNISYLNIPVLLSFNTNKELPVNLNVVVGPQFGLNVGSSVSTSGNANADTLRAVVAVKQGDVGAAYGAGLEFALNPAHTLRLDLGFRGFYGFVDMRATNTSSNPDTYNILVKASRKTYAGYLGLTFCF